MISPEMLNFAHHLNAKIVSLGDLSESNREVIEHSFMLGSSGAYFAVEDCIVINDHSPLKEEALLHELGHWSGNSERLNRGAIVRSKTNHIEVIDFHTEEVIAQYCMFYLSSIFNMDQTKIKECLDIYVISYPRANLVLGQYEGWAAAQWLISEAKRNGWVPNKWSIAS